MFNEVFGNALFSMHPYRSTKCCFRNNEICVVFFCYVLCSIVLCPECSQAQRIAVCCVVMPCFCLICPVLDCPLQSSEPVRLWLSLIENPVDFLDDVFQFDNRLISVFECGEFRFCLSQ